MDEKLLIKLLENQQRTIETLSEIVNKHEEWINLNFKDIEKLQDEVSELKQKLNAENTSNLTELFENLNPNK